jgi:hypothetical protein
MTFPPSSPDQEPEARFPSLSSSASSDEEAALIAFLRQHQPSVPAAPIVLEDQIMQAIALPRQRVAPQQPTRWEHLWTQWRRSWAVPSAVAASVLMAWGGYRLTLPAQPSAAELAQLQTFMESSWDGAVDNGYEEVIDGSTGSLSSDQNF